MIKAIDKESINSICSGQVIFDLSIAVKELIENSIDAGANSVEIRLKECGDELIEVIDNGSGVDPLNFKALTMKHCTSKLESFSDLLSIETYGFRGEALSSLCSLANVTITTRTSQQTTASKLVFDKEGKIITQTPVAREVGTTVSLTNLFKCLPVRYQEFKRNLKKEYAKLVTILQAYALISTGTRISCFNQQGKQPRACILSTTQGSTIRDNLISVFGTKLNQSLDEFTASDSLFKVSGLISKVGLGSGTGQSISQSSSASSQSASLSSLSRSCADRQFFFINSRPIEHSKLAKEINSLYHTFHKRGAYPVIIFNIETPTNNYDVNVTPDKRTIFLQREVQLIQLVSEGLKTMWEAAQSVFDTNNINNFTFDDLDQDDKKQQAQQSKISSFPNLYKLKSEEDNIKKAPTKNNNNTTTTTSTTTTPPRKSKSNEDDDDDGYVRPSFVNRDDDDDEQPLKKTKYDGAPKKQELPKTPYPSKKKLDDSGNDDYGDMGGGDGDEYVQPIFSKSVNKDDGGNGKNSKDNSLDDVISDIDLFKRNKASTDSSFMEDFEFKGISKKLNVNSNKSNNSGSSGSGSSNKVLDNINKTIENLSNKQQQQETKNNNDKKINNNNSKKLEEEIEDEGSIDGFQQKNAKTFDITIKTDLESISKQYLIRNGKYDQNNNPIIPSTKVVFSNTAGGSGDVGSSADINSHKCHSGEDELTKTQPCCIIDQELPQLEGKFSTSIGAVGVNKQSQQQQPSNVLQSQSEQELTKYLKKEYFKQMIVVGQFNLGFIIAKLGNDLFIIDQHAADEKYNFEMLSKSIVPSCQPLLRPNPLDELSHEEEMIIIENLDLFQSSGFKFIVDDNAPTKSKIKLSAYPVILGQTFGIKDIYEWIFLIKESSLPGQINKIPRLNSLLASKACRKSIMVGTALSHKEMKNVLNNLSTLDNPWACPHGRSTVRHLISNTSLKNVNQQNNNINNTNNTNNK